MRCRRRVQRNGKHANRPHDVLDLLLADVVKANIETAMHLLAHRRRHADSAGLGQRFQTRRHVDTVARDVGAVDDDVADVDADAELDALVGRFRLIICVHCPLHVDCAVERRIRAGEFEQHPVAGGLDHPATVFGNLRIDDAFADLAQPRKRPSIIALHVSAEADYISDEDRRQLAGDGTSIHGFHGRR